jgi:molybdopterin-guanine dinucleotide biosynthesis protein A
MTHNISAIVLAGGNSSRLGRDKALLQIYGSSTVIHTVVEKLQWISDDVIVATNGKKYADLRVRFTDDMYKNSGPLAGLHSGLLAAKHNRALVVACDMPFLNVNLLNHMVSQSLDDYALVPRIKDWLEPLHAVYSRQCIAPIDKMLNTSRFRMYDFLDTISIKYLSEDSIKMFDPQYRSFFNLNSPKSLKEAVDIAGG